MTTLVVLALLVAATFLIVCLTSGPTVPTVPFAEHADEACALTREPESDWRFERYPDSRPLMDDTLRQIEIAELEALYERAPRDPRRPPITPGQSAPSAPSPVEES